MKIIKADNYQTWYLENNNNAILIDPWLTNTLQPEGSFFIQRRNIVFYIKDKRIYIYAVVF